jgi:hypothetical protein
LDEVAVGADANVRVAARFDGCLGKHVFHCHNLKYEDMMASFDVIQDEKEFPVIVRTARMRFS